MLGKILVGLAFFVLGAVFTVAPQHMDQGTQNIGALVGFTCWVIGGVVLLIGLFSWGAPKGVPRRWS